MFLSNLSVRRPVVATVMMLALMTLGLFSVGRLPIDLYPEVEIPVLSILTEFPGASPESVEREVSRKIEEADLVGLGRTSGVSRLVDHGDRGTRHQAAGGISDFSGDRAECLREARRAKDQPRE